MNSEFADLWADIRNRVATSDLAESAELDSERLASMATTEEERLRAAATRISVSAARGNETMLWRGVADLRVVPHLMVPDVLGLFPELTVLGTPAQRWPILRPMIVELLGGDDDLGLAFISFPDDSTAADLIRADWEPNEALPNNVRSELKLQVGWAALERYIDQRCSRSWEIVGMRSIRLKQAVDPGWWEQQLQKAIVQLASGDETAAIALIEAMPRSKPPRWAKQRVNYYLARFGALASTNLAQWLAVAGEDLPTARQAQAGVDRAAMSITDMMVNRTKTTPQSLLDLGRELESYPWIVFAGFCNASLRPSGRGYLASMLVTLPKDELKRMHWTGREGVFARHVSDVEDRFDALVLAASGFQITKHSKIGEALRGIVDRVSAKELFELRRDRPELWGMVESLGAGLSIQRRSQLGRGGTYRAVVDGSNVMWGGLQRDHGARPSFSLLEQAMEDLARHGFEEILVYVDAATPYELSREENERLQRLRNSHRVSVVAGQADPHVIRALLAQPVASEFVTCDRYRKEMTDPEFGTQLGRLKADKWRRFHIAAGGRLEWEDPLDRRPRVV